MEGGGWLLSILKTPKQDYSLGPANGTGVHGYRIRLLLEATRIEAAPLYGRRPTETEGRVTIVFGLLVDYCYRTPNGLSRHALPSDCIYVLDSGTLVAIDSARLTALQGSDSAKEDFVKRLEAHLTEHRAFRATPVANGG